MRRLITEPQVAESGAGGSVGLADGSERVVVIPVVPTNDDGVLAEVVASESPVIEIEVTVVVDDLGCVADNLLIETDLVVVGDATDVTAETTKARVELSPNDSLGFNVTDGLSDDLLGEFLQNEQTLLNDLDLLNFAADELRLLHESLLELPSVKVIASVEVVEVIQRLESTPAVE